MARLTGELPGAAGTSARTEIELARLKDRPVRDKDELAGDENEPSRPK
jgi:hypothetical protein